MSTAKSKGKEIRGMTTLRIVCSQDGKTILSEPLVVHWLYFVLSLPLQPLLPMGWLQGPELRLRKGIQHLGGI